MKDDPKLLSCRSLADVIIAEVKTGQCNLNGPWTKRPKRNMDRVLSAIGCVPKNAFSSACGQLYDCGRWSDNAVTIRLFALGESRNNALPIPSKQQITWTEIVRFCINRFNEYEREKSSVGQWTEDGKRLRQLALADNAEEGIRHLFSLCVPARGTEIA